MTAAWLWARAELRARWRSWVVLGLLAGATAGIVAAGIAGARRTDSALPRYIAVAGSIDAAVLANDPTFDAKQRAAVAALPEVRQTFPFEVAVLANVTKPRGLDGTLFPLTAATARLSEPVIVEGRHTNPKNPNEAVIDQNIARQFKLGIGSTIVIRQFVPATIPSDAPPGLVPPGAKTFRERLRVVGITKATSSDKSWSPSSGLWAKHGKEVVGVTNMFVRLRHGQADFVRFQRDVQRVVGHPVNVASANDLLGLRKIRNIMGVERDGLLLFALAALLGGGVLVGQALVRAVTASGADAETWRAMGADRPIAVQGMVLPSLLTAAVAAVTAIAVGIALSPRFPIGVARRYELDVGIHADALVLGLAVLVLVIVIVAVAVAAAWWRVTRGEATRPATSRAARWATNAGFPPAMLIGARLAVEPGRGRRAVPVRSALIGAVVGVLGVVGCFTFRAGIADAASNPKRSGVVWNYEVASGASPIAVHDRARMAGDPAVGSALRALWSRAVPINGVATPTFGIATVRGRLPLVVLSGHAPRNASELALAPSTQRSLQLHVGDTVRVGKAPGRTVHVVGIAFLPSSSHTGYDESGWMTLAGLRAAVGPDAFAEAAGRLRGLPTLALATGSQCGGSGAPHLEGRRSARVLLAASDATDLGGRPRAPRFGSAGARRVLRVAGGGDGRARPRDHGAAAALRPRGVAFDGVHSASVAVCDRMASHVARGDRTARRSAARARDGARGVALGRRRVPGRVRDPDRGRSRCSWSCPWRCWSRKRSRPGRRTPPPASGPRRLFGPNSGAAGRRGSDREGEVRRELHREGGVAFDGDLVAVRLRVGAAAGQPEEEHDGQRDADGRGAIELAHDRGAVVNRHEDLVVERAGEVDAYTRALRHRGLAPDDVAERGQHLLEREAQRLDVGAVRGADCARACRARGGSSRSGGCA